MKITCVAISTFTLLVGVQAAIKDLTTVNDECETGCNSKLKLKISSVGFGFKPRQAKRDCVRKCSDGLEVAARQKICGKPCGLFFAKSGPRRSNVKFCQLCNGNVGAAVQKCRREINRLVRLCKRGCRRSRPFQIYNGQFLALSSGTAARFFPGKCSRQ